MNSSDRFLDSIFSITPNEISDEIYTKAKKCLVDYLCVTFAGAEQLKRANRGIILDNLEEGNSRILGFNKSSTVLEAAMYNGISSHVLELDDGHRFGMMHPGAPIISALLAVARDEQLTGSSFLYGIVIGYESAIRLASAIQPEHKLKGFHATATCGTVGAALGISAALSYSRNQQRSTLGAALTSASGLLEMIDDNSELKPFNVGKAALSGVAAAKIGKLEFMSPEDPLCGKRGFFNVITKLVNEDALYTLKNEKLCIEGIYVKPYAACRHCHSPIEAALNLRESIIENINDIKGIIVDTYSLAVYGHDSKSIESVSAAKMSTPYSVATALVLGNLGIECFSDEYIVRSDIIDLAGKIEVRENKEITSLAPEKRAAKVTIELYDGSTISAHVDYPKGEPENPISQEELEEKFYSLMRFSGKDFNESKRMLEYIYDLEDSFDEFLDLL